MDAPVDAIPFAHPQHNRNPYPFRFDAEPDRPVIVECVYTHDCYIWGLEDEWGLLQWLDEEFSFVPRVLALRAQFNELFPRTGVPMMWFRHNGYGLRQPLPFDQWVIRNYEPSAKDSRGFIPQMGRIVRGWAYEEAIALQELDAVEEAFLFSQAISLGIIPVPLVWE